jgi:hypothetical protein
VYDLLVTSKSVLAKKSAPNVARFFIYSILHKNINMYPLLVQGVFSNSQGTQRSLLPGAAIGSWNNVIKIGRGDLIAIDPIATNIDSAGSLSNSGNFTYYVSCQQVLDTAQISNYAVTN